MIVNYTVITFNQSVLNCEALRINVQIHLFEPIYIGYKKSILLNLN